ncbi:MATH domain-containing protein At5g43560 [Setaria italica]|uniref:MATH domain-containing protein At5g43560 n=1 Tax=Setaria italica TaxID=4555 RepID=UPI000BE607B8|nr:MATH domain-containing protein At5g43560 [Setaria italica]
MNALFELSVYNHSNGTYYGGKDSCSSTVKKTHSKKMCLIPLEVLKSSDYLVDDSCVVGVRILKANVFSPEKKPLVISKKHITVQNLFLQKKEFIRGTYTWTMSNYLDLKLLVNSPAFEVGGHKWYVNMYPLGDKYSTKSLSLFLHLHDPKELPDPKSGMMIELTLSILDVKHGKHFTRRFVFAAGDKAGWGWSNFIRLKTFKDPSRGYLLGSNCVLKADITITGSSNDG